LKAQGVTGRRFFEMIKAKAKEQGCPYGQWRSTLNRQDCNDDHGHSPKPPKSEPKKCDYDRHELRQCGNSRGHH
jgi:hypothetical protein